MLLLLHSQLQVSQDRLHRDKWAPSGPLAPMGYRKPIQCMHSIYSPRCSAVLATAATARRVLDRMLQLTGRAAAFRLERAMPWSRPARPARWPASACRILPAADGQSKTAVPVLLPRVAAIGQCTYALYIWYVQDLVPILCGQLGGRPTGPRPAWSDADWPPACGCAQRGHGPAQSPCGPLCNWLPVSHQVFSLAL